MPAFRSPREFRAVMDRAFALMDEDPETGPRRRDADVPQRSFARYRALLEREHPHLLA